MVVVGKLAAPPPLPIPAPAFPPGAKVTKGPQRIVEGRKISPRCGKVRQWVLFSQPDPLCRVLLDGRIPALSSFNMTGVGDLVT